MAYKRVFHHCHRCYVEMRKQRGTYCQKCRPWVARDARQPSAILLRATGKVPLRLAIRRGGGSWHLSRASLFGPLCGRKSVLGYEVGNTVSRAGLVQCRSCWAALKRILDEMDETAFRERMNAKREPR